MDPASFLEGRSRETKIRRDSQGRWFLEDDPLEHPNLVRAFDRWIDRAEDGRYCLKNDINWAYFTLEGPPFFVRSVRLEGDKITMSLSDDSTEQLDPATLRQASDGALYCNVRGSMAARFDRHAMQQLEPILQQDDKGVYLALGQARVRPPVASDPLADPTRTA
jgi:hypothetical protein